MSRAMRCRLRWLARSICRPSQVAATFVREGSQVAEGDTLLIIEAMKVMNPLPAPKGGHGEAGAWSLTDNLLNTVSRWS